MFILAQVNLPKKKKQAKRTKTLSFTSSRGQIAETLSFGGGTARLNGRFGTSSLLSSSENASIASSFSDEGSHPVVKQYSIPLSSLFESSKFFVLLLYLCTYYKFLDPVSPSSSVTAGVSPCKLIFISFLFILNFAHFRCHVFYIFWFWYEKT